MFSENILVGVTTFNKAGLVQLENENCLIANANKKFLNFQNITGNLGQTVSYELPSKYRVVHSLTGEQQPIVQRLQTITVNRPYLVQVGYSAEQLVYNLENYRGSIAEGAVASIGTDVEKDL